MTGGDFRLEGGERFAINLDGRQREPDIVLLTDGRDKCHRVQGLERLILHVREITEPLRGCPRHDRLVGLPVVRVFVSDPLLSKQDTLLSKDLDHLVITLAQHLLILEAIAHLGGKLAIVVDRTDEPAINDVPACADCGIVFSSVGWSTVDEAGTRCGGNVRRGDDFVWGESGGAEEREVGGSEELASCMCVRERERESRGDEGRTGWLAARNFETHP